MAERLTGSLESAIRMTLLSVLSDAADVITRELSPGSVGLRLRGREPSFVVTSSFAEPPQGAAEGGTEAAPDSGPPIAEDGPATRVNVRLPEQLKAVVEEAAAKEGCSVNAWLMQAALSALQCADQERRAEQSSSGKRSQQRFTGRVR
nr:MULTISPECIES: YlcI/YnfO family protein [unclassified Actinopolyspora]